MGDSVVAAWMADVGEGLGRGWVEGERGEVESQEGRLREMEGMFGRAAQVE